MRKLRAMNIQAGWRPDSASRPMSPKASTSSEEVAWASAAVARVRVSLSNSSSYPTTLCRSSAMGWRTTATSGRPVVVSASTLISPMVGIREKSLSASRASIHNCLPVAYSR
jgi:hypothetical protein